MTLYILVENPSAGLERAPFPFRDEQFIDGETPIDGISRDTLVGGLVAHGHRRALPLAGEEALADFVRAECRPGDILVCLGAGSISAWANGMPARLNSLNGAREPIDA